MNEDRRALLVMDVQNGIVSRYADTSDAMTPFVKAVETARQASIPVIFVRVAFREGYPEVSPRNKSFSAISKNGGMHTTDDTTAIHALLAGLRLSTAICERFQQHMHWLRPLE